MPPRWYGEASRRILLRWQPLALSLTCLSCSSTEQEDSALPRDTSTCSGCAIEVTEEPIVCENPELRESLGPFELVELPEIPLQDFPDGPDTTLASGVSVGDISGDGLLDIVLPHAGLPQLFVQKEDGRFVDEAALRWPDGLDGGTAAMVFDINSDGHSDVFWCSGPIPLSGEPVPILNRLYLNNGDGTLRDASSEWGLEASTFRPCYGGSFGDVDGDDDLDIALAINEFCGPVDPGTGSSECSHILDYASSRNLWLQNENTLVDASTRLPQQLALSSFSHVSTLIDIDGDQDLDLYLTNDTKDEIPFAINNLLFTNDGTGHFEHDEHNTHGLHIHIAGMGLGVGDLNDDARPDLLMTGTANAYLMMSSAGPWYEAAQALGLVFHDNPDRVEGWGVELADLDNDGDLDAPMMFGALYLTDNMRHMPDAFFENTGEGFEQVAESYGLADDGMGRGQLSVDLNGDGWLDLLKRELGGQLLYYRARCGENAWTTIALQQPGGNREAIGAVIEVTAQDSTQRRWVLGAGTSLASNGPSAQHFGLGEAEAIDQVLVKWPDGEETRYTNLPVNTPLTLER